MTSAGGAQRSTLISTASLRRAAGRLAAIVPAELAAELEDLTPAQFRELLEDFADAQAAREALAEVEAGAEPIPAEQVWAELGRGT